MGTKGPEESGSTLLRQPDMGGGQAEGGGRPPGTAPVGAFADEGSDPGTTGPWRAAEGELVAATEDGFPGSSVVHREDALTEGRFVGVAPDAPRGPLYEGPERRKTQADWGHWREQDRRVRPYDYPQHQRA